MLGPIQPPMSKRTPEVPSSIDQKEFSISRKGYDKREVREFLREIEGNFRELENWASETKNRLQQAEFEASKSKEIEDQSVDNAMIAVFDAKDRVLDRARKQADRIEAEARQKAADIEQQARHLLDSTSEEAGVPVVETESGGEKHVERSKGQVL